MNQQNRARALFILSMAIFGSMGYFVRFVSLPSGVISMVRGFVGALFLLLVLLFQRKRIDWGNIKKYFLPLCVSGCFLAFDWILFLEAYRYTTVAVATLCYYLAPAYVVLLSPLLLKEKLTAKKIICVAIAIFGMVLVSGIIQAGGAEIDLRGVACSLIAACFYASIVIINQKLKALAPMERTILQLGISALVMLPYNLITQDFSSFSLDGTGLLCLLILAVVHTGVAYGLYFTSFQQLSGQAVALFSYVDPVVAVFVSTLLLHEPMDLLCGIGAVLVLGSTLYGELADSGKAAKDDSVSG